jgi:putative FmdB family regulatory protein
MPIYEYQCSQCGQTIDVLQKLSDPAPATCAQCGAENSFRRKVSRTSFVLKGGGWSADLYSSRKKEAPSSGESGTATSTKASSGDSSSGGGSSGTTSAAAAPNK